MAVTTIYSCRSRFGGIEVRDAHKLKGLKDETGG
jgi:hypothetical protein